MIMSARKVKLAVFSNSKRQVHFLSKDFFTSTVVGSCLCLTKHSELYMALLLLRSQILYCNLILILSSSSVAKPTHDLIKVAVQP